MSTVQLVVLPGIVNGNALRLVSIHFDWTYSPLAYPGDVYFPSTYNDGSPTQDQRIGDLVYPARMMKRDGYGRTTKATRAKPSGPMTISWEGTQWPI